MTDPHKILSNALAGATINGRGATILSYCWPHVKFRNRLLAIIAVFLRNIYMVLIALSGVIAGGDRFFIFREFSNGVMFLLIPLTFFIRGRCIFNVNHNLKNIEHRFPWSIRVMSVLGYYFLIFDGQNLVTYIPPNLRKAFIFTPFPCVAMGGAYKKTEGGVARIGVVGDFRSEKTDSTEFSGILKSVSEMSRSTIQIGVRSSVALRDVSVPDGVLVRSTAGHSEYISFLSDCDVLLVLAKREAYFSRNSGTIMDAIACGVIPVVPNLPVLESQVTTPRKVGVVYSDYFGIQKSIVEAIEKMNALRSAMDDYLAMRGLPVQLFLDRQ